VWSSWSADAISDSAIELCLTLESLFKLPLRQVTGLLGSVIKLAGLDWPVLHYTTLSRRQKTLMVELGGRPNSGGLRLLVYSTGIKMTGEGEWKTRKHGTSYRRQWRKVHLGTDPGTLDIRASKLRRMPSTMRRRCRVCRRRSRMTRRYSASAEMALTIPGRAMLPLPNVVPMRSSRSATTGGDGRKTALASMLAMKRYALQGAL
jgi:hypothetical protein